MEENGYFSEFTPKANVEESILLSVKKLLGIEPDNIEFDVDVIFNINAAIATLIQIGVGEYQDFVLSSEFDTYDDFLGPMCPEKSQVKMYLYYKTKLGFDPPQSSIVSASIKDMISELEWRLNASVDPANTFSRARGWMEGGGSL